MGLNDELSRKYPAKDHAHRVVEFLKAAGHDLNNAIIYLEGQKTRMIEDNDGEAPFRQRRYFFYLSGCDVPDCALAYNTSTKKLTLFTPPIDPDSVVWSGLPLSPEEALERYDIDEALEAGEVNGYLAHNADALKGKGQSYAYAISEQVSDAVTFLPFDKTDLVVVKDAIERCRVVKDSYELALIRKANEVSAIAHAAVLDQATSATNERELAATFVAKSMASGCEQAYHGIIASGTNAATLHYMKNNEPLANRLNLLVDAAAEYSCYCADVTRTFPISGTFSKESKVIYDIVDEMQRSCFKLLKEGVQWESVHENAHKVAIRGLQAAGILVGDEEEIFDKRVSVAFFPHGLGHYLGEDTHDTGGNPNYADKDSMFRYLRVRGTLPAGCVITVEPGIYFCRFIIEPVLKDPELSKYIDKTVLERYWEVGGVRIEDDIHITKDGYENLTTAPKI